MATLPMRTECRLATGDLVGWTGGFWIGAAPDMVGGVCLDSRVVVPGDLFVALGGTTADGHRFIEAAAARGAAAALVCRDVAMPPLPCLKVVDTLQALHAIAGSYRERFPGMVAALTGSVGKTTVKDMTAAILGRVGSTVSTSGNFNNATGVPLTLLALESRHRFAVVEIGMSFPGEIAALVPLVRPHIAAVTNVKPVHLQNFLSLADIAAAKAEILPGMEPGGVAVLNADDPHVRVMTPPEGIRIVWFGHDSTADLRLSGVSRTEVDRQHFTLTWRNQVMDVTLHVPGGHNRMNAASAGAISLSAGASPDDIVAGLAAFTPSPLRSRLVYLRDGSILLEDCYNASPDAFAAALRTVAELPVQGRRVLVMGDMRELGDAAQVYHRDLGVQAAAAGVSRLLGFGPLADTAVQAFRRAGGEGRHFERIQELVSSLLADHIPGDIVLIKGSRALALERVSTALLAEIPPAQPDGPAPRPGDSAP